MEYTELNFIIEPFSQETVEILMASLSQFAFESFAETEKGCKAYVLTDNYSEDEVKEVIKQLPENLGEIHYISSEIEQQNWNETWESNFDPIIVKDKCIIYAPFHQNIPKLDFNILIEPKMAFGTGHHATTEMMIEHLLNIDIEDKRVLDMGTGTGVLAILASLKDAALIYAVDNDKWAYNNCVENIENNKCQNIFAIEGDIESIKNELFDLVLANINRNTLIKDIPMYINSLNAGGDLIMSGFYVDDIPAIEQVANRNDLFLKKYLEKDNWASVVFSEK